MMMRLPASLVLFLAILGLNRDRCVADDPPDAVESRRAIEDLVADYVRAFNARDARTLASLFTKDARIQTDDGPGVEGREAIQVHFAYVFEDDARRSILVEPESLRFLGPDAAVEEGLATIVKSAESPYDRDEVSRRRYTAAYIRKDGRWLQDQIHDHSNADPDAAIPPRERLTALEWLVGEWIDEDDDAEVETSCDWEEDGAFLVRRFHMKAEGSLVMSGVQRIGWDPRFKQFRSWTFDSDGGFSEGLWSRDVENERERWIVKTTGVLKDGRSATATNVVTREGPDVLRWSSTDRTLGAAAFPDVETIVLVRKPPQPQAASTFTAPTESAGTQP